MGCGSLNSFNTLKINLEHEPSSPLPPTAMIGDKLLKRMHVNLDEVHARFLQEWEQHTKHTNSHSLPLAPPPPDALAHSPQAQPTQESSSSGDVQVFERVDRVPPSHPRHPEAGPSSTVAPPPPPPAPSSDLPLILEAIKHLSKNFLHLGRRLDYFENQCHACFDYLDQEIASLRQQAYHPPSPPASHVSYHPHHDHAPSEGFHDTLLCPHTHISPILHTDDFYISYHSHPVPPAPALAPPVLSTPTPAPAHPTPPAHVSTPLAPATGHHSSPS